MRASNTHRFLTSFKELQKWNEKNKVKMPLRMVKQQAQAMMQRYKKQVRRVARGVFTTKYYSKDTNLVTLDGGAYLLVASAVDRLDVDDQDIDIMGTIRVPHIHTPFLPVLHITRPYIPQALGSIDPIQMHIEMYKAMDQNSEILSAPDDSVATWSTEEKAKCKADTQRRTRVSLPWVSLYDLSMKIRRTDDVHAQRYALHLALATRLCDPSVGVSRTLWGVMDKVGEEKSVVAGFTNMQLFDQDCSTVCEYEVQRTTYPGMQCHAV